MWRFLLTFLALVASLPVFAARIVKVDLVPSLNRNGFVEKYVLNTHLFVERGENPAPLLIRAFRIQVTAEGTWEQRPVMAGEAAFQMDDTSKIFGKTYKFTPEFPDNAAPFVISETKIEIPTSALEMPKEGFVEFAFVAAFYSANSIDSPVATKLNMVMMSGTRHRLLIPDLPSESAEIPLEIEGNKIDERGNVTPAGHKMTVNLSREKESVTLEENGELGEKKKKLLPNELADAQPTGELAPSKVKVFFATNRLVKRVTPSKQTKGLGFEFTTAMRAPGKNGLTYGTATVNLPAREQEQAYWGRQYATILNVSYPMGPQQFFKLVTEPDPAIKDSTRDVLLNLQGFNNSFDAQIAQTARWKRDLNFLGNVLSFSWPSQGDWTKYDDDELMAEASVDALKEVLETLIVETRKTGGEIHAIVHSLGNRILTLAVQKLYMEKDREGKAEEFFAGKPIGIMILAAPDVDQFLFGSVLATMTDMAEQISFYWTAKDWALKWSNKLHPGMVRAGLLPAYNRRIVDTIDVGKAVDFCSMGHSWYTSADPVVFDIFLQFKYRWRADKRHPPLSLDQAILQKISFNHWVLTPP